ncbi:MAG TPA: DHH family phosphoesterase, partial [Anaerolineales bacterium]|nr:DHH family phosphoesterase [Anaerolineales bacterium]
MPTPTPKKRWQINPQITPIAAQNLVEYSAVLQQILFNRGHATAESARRYLEASPPPDSEPERMLGISESVERIRYALKHNEKIAIYGDYDVDGVTATALLTEVLRGLGGSEIIPYIPNRFEEGYGLNREALELLKDNGVSLVITVDCGIRSLPEAEAARKLGLDMIITDHHHPHTDLP